MTLEYIIVCTNNLELIKIVTLSDEHLLLPWECVDGSDDLVSDSSSLGKGVVTSDAINNWGSGLDNLISNLESLLETL